MIRSARILLSVAQVDAAMLARRLAARLELSGVLTRIEISACLVEPEEQIGIALGDFQDLATWLAQPNRYHFSPLDWSGMRAFCDQQFPLDHAVHTVLKAVCEQGIMVTPGEYWHLGGAAGEGLLLDFAPPEWALVQALQARGDTLALAESCTGGGLAARITNVPGASAVFQSGMVTYSNGAKELLLGVLPETLARTGAVSEPTALEMLAGALRQAEWAAAITGIAGPGGATPGKPVGTVCIAWGRRQGPQCVDTFHFPGDRWAVRHAAGNVALGRLLELIHEPAG